MKPLLQRSHTRAATVFGTFALAGCVSAPLASSSAALPPAPAGAQQSAPAAGQVEASTDVVSGPQLEQDVTLLIDPSSGAISTVGSRSALDVIQSQLALDINAVSLVQSGSTTTFQLLVNNPGSPLLQLVMNFSSNRTLTSPGTSGPLGAVASGGQVQQTVSVNNPGGGPFTLTVSILATLQAHGPVSIANQAPVPLASTPVLNGAALQTSPRFELNPGAGAIRGRILMNGKVPAKSFALTLVHSQNGVWTNSQTLTTDPKGNYAASGLADGNYLVYFYNDSQRDVIGYWSSSTLAVNNAAGATFPAIDFSQRGLLGVPAVDAHVQLPTNFQWTPQAQAVVSYRWRLHSTAGRTYTLLYQSDKLDPTATTFAWNGGGLSLSPRNRYFWGLAWDAGPAGVGGNLFQAVYLSS